MCDAAKFKTMEERMDGFEDRLDRVESSITTGFISVNTAVANLATEFGTRMNTIDRRLVEEKQKWGETLRSILVWSVRVILAGAGTAMGITAFKIFAN